MRAWPAAVVLVCCVQNGGGTGQAQQRLDPCMNGDPMCQTTGNGGGSSGNGGSTTDPCAQLDATACAQKTPFCQAVTDCPKCNDPTMCSERPCVFVGCQLAVPPDRCAGLAEQSCNETSGCQGVYQTACTTTDPMGTSNGMTPDKTDSSTGQNCAHVYSGCTADTACGNAPDQTQHP
jgi:hypothetical protein